MASALLPALHATWPGCHVTWVTDTPLVPLVHRLHGVHEVIGVDLRPLLSGSVARKLHAALKLATRLAFRHWDVVILAHKDRRYRALLAGARYGRVVQSPPHEPLTTRGRYMGEEYTDLLHAVLAEPTPAGTRPPATLATLRAHETPAPPTEPQIDVLLAPGGARNLLRDDPLRRWPRDHWERLAGALTAQGLRVALVGGSADAEDASAVARAVPAVRNLAGQTSLPGLLALLEHARVLVTHDAGPLHLAALTRTPTVALFGPTVPEERIPPGAPMVVASAAAGLPCAPCYNGRDYAPCSRNRCLADLSVETVLGLAEEQLMRSSR